MLDINENNIGDHLFKFYKEKHGSSVWLFISYHFEYTSDNIVVDTIAFYSHAITGELLVKKEEYYAEDFLYDIEISAKEVISSGLNPKDAFKYMTPIQVAKYRAKHNI